MPGPSFTVLHYSTVQRMEFGHCPVCSLLGVTFKACSVTFALSVDNSSQAPESKLLPVSQILRMT
ncbi:hypothetical protein M514_10684 [Trichuris suis]|uniref:Uncharacterized protein n=1 Tax=Trichuris suis TaxID=68888 RepID=A0A085LU20_9BILA|nr:hypothetical protein M513_10684 [Trichuris suis]KFD62134.1 hypothetical protein M514_10684 [Trichuris suis]